MYFVSFLSYLSLIYWFGFGKLDLTDKFIIRQILCHMRKPISKE